MSLPTIKKNTMNIVSLSTLHAEYIPQQYFSIIKPFWCGFGSEKEHYVSQELSPYISFIKKYTDDVNTYVEFPQNPVEDLLFKAEDDESISVLEKLIEQGDLLTHSSRDTCNNRKQESKDEQYCKILGLAYLLEEQEYDIWEEYMYIRHRTKDLQEYISSSLDNLESQLEIATYSHVVNTIKAILYYCREHTQLIFASHSQAVEEFLQPYILYDEMPQNTPELFDKYLTGHYKGYIPDLGIIPEFTDVCPTAQSVLILDQSVYHRIL